MRNYSLRSAMMKNTTKPTMKATIIDMIITIMQYNEMDSKKNSAIDLQNIPRMA